jgi:hypothetical protein
MKKEEGRQPKVLRENYLSVPKSRFQWLNKSNKDERVPY